MNRTKSTGMGSRVDPNTKINRSLMDIIDEFKETNKTLKAILKQLEGDK